jgi:hypothetical protein
MLAGDQLGQILRLLLEAGPAADLVDAQVRVRAVAQADRSGRSADFLARYEMLEIAETKPAMLFFDGDTVQPQLAHPRFDMIERKPARRVPNGIRHLAQSKIHLRHLRSPVVVATLLRLCLPRQN